ncbi:hypothetical protein [Agrobacterium tumefaciens]|uniref:hypothetical protein n=1 Tax=Agrobacterium tumefaciens TaxID=358 RepID=UPI001573E832|nr:hypothetical protein [Agrobacterium tumefaciens]
MDISWVREPEFWSANRAERARVGAHELVAFDIPGVDSSPAIIGWELFTGPKFNDLIAKGDAETFAHAQVAAEAAYLAAVTRESTSNPN